MLRLELQPYPWSCLASSMAMVLGLATEEFHRLAGHDGSDIVYPWLPEPQCRRGFHIQEAVHVAMKLGRTVTPFELFPRTAPSSPPPNALDDGALLIRYDNAEDLGHNWDLFKHLLLTGQGVIECQMRSNNWHAVAYYFNYIFNPRGEVYEYSRESCEARGLITTRLWQVTKCSPK